MKFKRWGNLVPQKHFRKNGLKSFNYAPDAFVKNKQKELYRFSYKPEWCFKSYKAQGRHIGLPNATLDFGEFEVFIEKVK